MTDPIVDAGEGASMGRAFEVGGIWIAPLGSRGIPAGELGIELECAGVFGSGLHPTTQLCVERLIELPPAESILDVGSGTGILGLVALRLGTMRAVLLDSDPRARRVSAANAARNAMAARVTVEARTLRGLEERFPLVVANMPSAELIELAPALARSLDSDGHLVLSGIYQTQVEEVRRVFRDLGVNAGAVYERSEWCAVVMWPSW